MKLDVDVNVYKTCKISIEGHAFQLNTIV